MSTKMTRAEFLRISCLGTAGLAFGTGIKLDAATAKTSSADLKPSWKSTFVPDFKPKLSERTRALAQRGLAGEWGHAMTEVDWDITGCFQEGQGPQVTYGKLAVNLAANAPVRVLPEELLAGSAVLKDAARHLIPGWKTGSISHTTLGFGRAMELGYSGLRKEILERMERGGLDETGKDVLEGMLLCIEAAGIWNQRHIDALAALLPSAKPEDREHLRKTIDILHRVPENKPADFREAVQCLWSMWEFNRFMGNWSGIGRIDQMLGGYLKEDLRRGAITLGEARELLAHFWIKGTDWITTDVSGSGDAQFYQNIILSGIDRNGKDITNEVTYLILDIVEELHISDYPVAVRISTRTPDKLLRRIAEVQRYGGGIISVYNEDKVIEAMTKFGYPLEEAREFTNDGCWETIIPGKTCFIYAPCDMVPVLNHAIGNEAGIAVTEYPDFEALYSRFTEVLRENVGNVHNALDGWNTAKETPCALASLFAEGCVEKGRSYSNRGPVYNVHGIHYGGIADVANSLLVLKKLVFEEKYMTLNEFVDILRNDWSGKEALRQLIRTRFEFFGNDNDEADRMMTRVVSDYADIVGSLKERNGILRHGAISTFGREIDWKDMRASLPEGSRRGDILATNCSPTPGSDRKGPTSVLNSYCKLDFSKLPNGGTLELKILPQSIQGENGVKALTSLSKTFVSKGGFYMHIDVVDTSTLIDAQMHPEKYPNLPVRVAGWSARFTTLCKEWQDMIIQRTQQIV